MTAPPPPPRLSRRWRWRRSPLRRPVELLEAWIRVALAVTVLVSVPSAALLVGQSVHRSLHATAQEQSRSGHWTRAVLTHEAPQHPEPGSPESEHARYPVPVRFTAPDGTERTGSAEVRPASAAGSTVRVWSNGDGELTDPPLTPGQIHDRTAIWAAASGAAVALLGATAHVTTRCALQRARMKRWATAWAETSPRWTTSAWRRE